MITIKNKIYKLIITSLIIFFPLISNAGIFFDDQKDGAGKTIINQWSNFSNKSYGENMPKEPEEVVAQIVSYLLSFLGVIFIILMIYAGFLWMTARGEADQITKAKDILTSSLIGIIIVLSSYLITTTILEKLGEATGTK